MTPFVLVTGNRHKVAEAERILGRPVEQLALDLPEIQSLDLREVLAAKAAEAWRRLGRPLIVEESGLDLPALGGFPGPLVRWMLEAAGAAGIARTALALDDGRAVARCALLLRRDGDPSGDLLVEAAVDGHLVLPPRGAGGFGWDTVFVTDGERRTNAELSDEEKDALSPRGRAWRRLAPLLASPPPRDVSS
ncbi:MAG TPA: non-canonical purine NTP pyrophosphatase [Thermoanaerobaculia bacterium]|nr:non-canonical purine NTP pyrophosphatase [Thermoanaerobaculia bacterium]